MATTKSVSNISQVQKLLKVLENKPIPETASESFGSLLQSLYSGNGAAPSGGTESNLSQMFSDIASSNKSHAKAAEQDRKEKPIDEKERPDSQSFKIKDDNTNRLAKSKDDQEERRDINQDDISEDRGEDAAAQRAREQKLSDAEGLQKDEADASALAASSAHSSQKEGATEAQTNDGPKKEEASSQRKSVESNVEVLKSEGQATGNPGVLVEEHLAKTEVQPESTTKNAVRSDGQASSKQETVTKTSEKPNPSATKAGANVPLTAPDQSSVNANNQPVDEQATLAVAQQKVTEQKGVLPKSQIAPEVEATVVIKEQEKAPSAKGQAVESTSTKQESKNTGEETQQKPQVFTDYLLKEGQAKDSKALLGMRPAAFASNMLGKVETSVSSGQATHSLSTKEAASAVAQSLRETGNLTNGGPRGVSPQRELFTVNSETGKVTVSSRGSTTLERIEKILVSTIQQRDVNTVVVRLDPPELGQVVMRVTQKGDELNARIIPENKAVEDLLRTKSGDLAQVISGAGIKLENVSISIGSAQSPADTGAKEGSLAFNGAGDQKGQFNDNGQGSSERRMNRERNETSFGQMDLSSREKLNMGFLDAGWLA